MAPLVVLPERTRWTWWCCQCQRGEHFTGPDGRERRDADAERHRALCHVPAPAGLDA